MLPLYTKMISTYWMSGWSWSEYNPGCDVCENKQNEMKPKSDQAVARYTFT